MGTETVPRDHALEVELAALRARAYGAHADIADDAAALERLRELEAWHAAGVRGAADNDQASRSDGSSASVPAEPGATADPTAAARPSRGRALLRRAARTGAGLFALGAAAMAVAVLLGAVVFAWSSPRPDAVLAAVDAQPQPHVLRLVDYARELLIDKTTLHGYEPFHDVELWGADSALGNSCLIALERSSDRLLAATCVPPGAEPVIQIYDVPIRALDEWHEGLPVGSMVRFILSGDEVSAWVYEGSPPD